MLKRLIVLLALFGGVFSGSLHATHIAGGDVAVTSIGNGQYVIQFNIFRDCFGISMPTSIIAQIDNPCGGSSSITLPLINPPTGLNISQLCPSDSLNSTCFGGTLPGMQMYIYLDTVTFSPPCDGIVISWSTCCRNDANLNLQSPGAADSYFAATVNLATEPANSTPFFTAQPIPYVCQNQLVSYNYGVVELDGDSLFFEFVCAQEAGAACAPYAGGYSAAAPIPGITIDSQTGQITFTPTLLGNFTVVVQVTEYDDNGNVLSVTFRDIQFVVIPCTNQVPDPNAGQITGLVGTGSTIQTGPYEIELCEGSSFTFTASYNDPDASDSLSVVTNLQTVLPGATITFSGANPLVATISWTAPGGTAGTNTNFTLTVNDGACPVTGIQTFVYAINVIESTVASVVPLNICQGGSGTLSASGGAVFTWFDLAGNQIPVSPTFSCNPCQTPAITPPATTTYVVVSDLSGTCINVDTITVNVVPDFTWNITVDNPNPCAQASVNITTTPNPAGTYTYQWSPPAGLSATNVSNPSVTQLLGGTYTYFLNITSSLGCAKNDSISIVYSPSIAPVLAASFDTACVNDTTHVQVFITNAVPSTCGPSASPCGAFTNDVEIGTGNVFSLPTSTVQPAPYANFYKNGKQQYLFTAQQLAQNGFVGGKISAVTFNVSSLNNSTTLYKGYTIRMKCTTSNDLSFQLLAETNLTTVYPATDYTVQVGPNLHQFTQAFDWDGTSNLLMEVCFDNLSDPTYTQNCSGPITPTTYGATAIWISDIDPVCPDPNIVGVVNFLPDVTFTYCGADPDPADYTVSWSPTTNVISPNILDPIILPGGPTNFTVTVVSNVGLCSDTVDLELAYTTQYNAQILNSDTSFCGNEPVVQLLGSPNNGVWGGSPQITTAGTFNPSTAGLGNYQATYQVGIGTQCYDADTVTLVVDAAPDASITTPPTSFCPGDPGIQLQALNPGGTWSGPGINPVTALFNPAGAPQGPNTILYIIPNPCPDTGIVVMTVNSAPTVNITPLAPMCITDPAVPLQSVILPFGTPGTWSGPGVDPVNQTFTPATAGAGSHTITLTATDPVSTCETTSSITVVVGSLPNASILSFPDTICSNAAIVQIIPAQTGGVFSGPGVQANGSFNPASVAPGLQTVTYTISNGGCTAQAQVTILVAPVPLAPVVTISDTTCTGVPVTNTITATGTGGTLTGLTWYSDQALNNPINNGPSLQGSISNATTVYVVQTGVGGCVGAPTTVNVPFYSNPSVQASADSLTGEVPLSVDFTSILSSDVTTWSWDFNGDGVIDQSNASFPSFTYQDSGVYTVTLIGVNAGGCTDTAILVIDADLNIQELVPNVFSPDGDGKNDEFRFVLNPNDVSTFSAVIFDRWGRKVVEFASYKDTWDGANYPAGTYYYVIDGTRRNGDKITPASGFFKMVK